MIIAITGSIGCGKSEVLRILNDNNWVCLDCDDIAHDLLLNPKFKRRLFDHFGESIFDANNNIDRKKLSELVFSNKDHRKFLEDNMHPIILDYVIKFRTIIKNENLNGAVAVPLLFETNFVDGWDKIVCIASSDNNIRTRLRMRQWTDVHIDERLSCQLPLQVKIDRSDLTIYNDTSISDLESKIKQLMTDLNSNESNLNKLKID